MFELGFVKRWIADRGVGFITWDHGAGDIYCHSTDLGDPGVSSLPIRARVRFEVVPDARDGRRTKAVDVRVVA